VTTGHGRKSCNSSGREAEERMSMVARNKAALNARAVHAATIDFRAFT
jgi:hypothetical protein